MPRVLRQRVVPYLARQMYDLVNDIEHYPEFMPWCVGSRVLHRSEHEVSASLSFSKGGVRQSFSTCNTLVPHNRIEMKLLEGPFKHLTGIWQFNDLPGGGSEVLLDLQFEFSNRLIAMMFGPVFNHVVQSLVGSFSDQAREVYA